MFNKIVHVFNVYSILFFILCLSFFNNVNSSIKGCYFGILGMVVSFLVTSLYFLNLNNLFLCLLVIIIGGILGIYISKKINISQVPELISLFHSFVGFSSMVISFNNLNKNILLNKLFIFEIILGNIIGSVTFIGSLVSFFILRNIFLFKNKFLINKNIFIFSLLILFVLILFFFNLKHYLYFKYLYFLISLLSLFLGYVLVVNVNISDVSILISLLNSYSGLVNSISGFVLDNNLLIVIGALTGSCGFLLSNIMCKLINKSLYKVIIFNIFIKKKTDIFDNIENKKNKLIKYNINNVVDFLLSSKSIIIVPGYGMAVSQSQYIIGKIVNILIKKYNLNVKFAVHPIAGRLPGHMNVLLAESNISSKYVYSLEDINDKFSENDLVLVIGANDIINPRSIYDKNCILYGMPVLKVWESKFVIILKRNFYNYATGYSKVNNSIFLRKNVGLLLGDAKFNLVKIFNLL